MRVMAYGPGGLSESDLTDPALLDGLLERHAVVWVDVEGLADVELLRDLGRRFGLHQLALEDVLSGHQRAKTEDYADHLFIITRMPWQNRPFVSEQLALFLARGVVLSFQEGHPGDSFEPVRERLRRASGRIREEGADYLCYALLDAAIDSYFPLLEDYGEQLEALEARVMAGAGAGIIQEIHGLKRDLLELRRVLWPQRELLHTLIRGDSSLIGERTRLYLRDCYDHVAQLMDMLETYREVASALVDIFLSTVSSRMNETMKILTLISTVFIPLSFIAGVYGMNFDTSVSPWNMPELDWYLGYPFALGLMGMVALGFLLLFYRKGWLGRGESRRR